MVDLPLYWMMDIGGIYDTRNNSNGGGDSIIKNPIGAFITGGFGEVIDAPIGTRISDADGNTIDVPRARSYENIPKRWKADLRLISDYERKTKEKKKEARARKWAKIRKVIKSLLHNIKEKLKE